MGATTNSSEYVVTTLTNCVDSVLVENFRPDLVVYLVAGTISHELLCGLAFYPVPFTLPQLHE